MPRNIEIKEEDNVTKIVVDFSKDEHKYSPNQIESLMSALDESEELITFRKFTKTTSEVEWPENGICKIKFSRIIRPAEITAILEGQRSGGMRPLPIIEQIANIIGRKEYEFAKHKEKATAESKDKTEKPPENTKSTRKRWFF